MKRGEIRWYTFRLPDKRRPVLILARNEVIDRLNEIIVAPATRSIRGLKTEVELTLDLDPEFVYARCMSPRPTMKRLLLLVMSCAWIATIAETTHACTCNEYDVPVCAA